MSWLKRLFGKPKTTLPDDFVSLLSESREHLAGLTMIHQQTWGLQKHAEWRLFYEQGILRFSFADGRTVNCTAQAIGSCNTQHGTWMWAWGNRSLAEWPHLLRYANELREYGSERGLPMLTTPAWPGGLDDGWTMTALAVKLCGGSGAYCGIKGSLHMFLAFHDVSLNRFTIFDEDPKSPD